jgi:Flp pilus assembly protein TadG
MRKQRGVTMIGWIFLLTPMAIVLYAGIRVGPEYLNYYKVVQALSESATALKSDETLTVQTIRGAISKRFDTGYIEKPSADDIIIKKGDKGWEMNADYEATSPLFGNLYLLMAFKKTVVINN